MSRRKTNRSQLENIVSYLQGVMTYEEPGHTWRCVEYNKFTRTAKFLCIKPDHDDYYVYLPYKGAASS